MLVYHGSNCEIDDIKLSKGTKFKDFGQGFYVTPDIETAKRMAKKKVNLFKGQPIITTYELDDSAFYSSELSVLQFPEKATAEWIIFIEGNRNRHNPAPPHNYDIVKGPIADDGVALQLGRLRAHADSAEVLARDLQDKFLDQQIYFGTPRSLKYLKKLSACKLD